MPRVQYSERSTSAAAEKPTLIWQHAGRKAGEYPLFQERPVTIGRDPNSTIHIDSPYVSKTHATVSYKNGEWAVEDHNSANGTRVNGNPIRVHLGLHAGDQIEIGDELIRFVDPEKEDTRKKKDKPAAPAAAGVNKAVRLAMVAGVTGLLLFGVMFMLMRSSDTSGQQQAGAPLAQRPAPAITQATRDASRRIVDTALVNQILDRARRTGVNEADALHDEGMMNLQGNRYREAVQLFAAALARRPNDASIKSRMADAEILLDQSIADAIAEADAATTQLRYDDARLAWDRVIALTYPGDPRYAKAMDSQTKLEAERRKRQGR